MLPADNIRTGPLRETTPSSIRTAILENRCPSISLLNPCGAHALHAGLLLILAASCFAFPDLHSAFARNATPAHQYGAPSPPGRLGTQQAQLPIPAHTLSNFSPIPMDTRESIRSRGRGAQNSMYLVHRCPLLSGSAPFSAALCVSHAFHWEIYILHFSFVLCASASAPHCSFRPLVAFPCLVFVSTIFLLPSLLPLTCRTCIYVLAVLGQSRRQAYTGSSTVVQRQHYRPRQSNETPSKAPCRIDPTEHQPLYHSYYATSTINQASSAPVKMFYRMYLSSTSSSNPSTRKLPQASPQLQEHPHPFTTLTRIPANPTLHPGVCQRRSWSEPIYEPTRTRSGHYCKVVVNNREYSTDVPYETEELARDGAAMKAFMICRNFSSNDGYYPGQRPGQRSANGVMQGVPVPIGSGRRARDSNRISAGSYGSSSTSSSPPSSSESFSEGTSSGGNSPKSLESGFEAAQMGYNTPRAVMSQPKPVSSRHKHQHAHPQRTQYRDEYFCLCKRAPVWAYGRCQFCVRENGWA